MNTYQRTEIFPYRMQDLIDVIMDGQTYQDISEYVQRVEVTETGPHKKTLQATIETPVIPMAFHYGCDLEHIPPDRILAVATKSPFKLFQGALYFRSLPNGHTAIDCEIEYKTGMNPIAIIGARVLPGQIEENMKHIHNFLAQKLQPVEVVVQPVRRPGPAPF